MGTADSIHNDPMRLAELALGDRKVELTKLVGNPATCSAGPTDYVNTPY